MKTADVAGLPVRLGAAVRGARLFHPHGVLATGTVSRVAAPLAQVGSGTAKFGSCRWRRSAGSGSAKRTARP